MRIEAEDEIALGLHEAFHLSTDIARLERRAMRRGIEVVRLTDGAPSDVSWRISGEIADAARIAEIEVIDWTEPEALALRGVTGGLNAHIRVRFTPLTAGRTRARVEIDFAASSLRHRVALATLSLAKGRLSAWLEKGLASHLRDVERAASG